MRSHDMMRTGRTTRWIAGPLAGLLVAAALAGCRNAKPLKSPYERDGLRLNKTFAVLPAINQTGEDVIAREDYDVQSVFVGQLQQVRGLHVLPMARVRAYLANKGTMMVRTPQEAAQMARELDVDGIVAVAFTRFDPYEPPIVGMTVALFRRPLRAGPEMIDPVSLSRQPTLVTHEPRQTELVNQQVFEFDARSAEVMERVRAFAERRAGPTESPWGWRRYVVSAAEYLRFCSYEAIRTLLRAEKAALAASRKRAAGPVAATDMPHGEPP
jgi:hypothetical protein